MAEAAREWYLVTGAAGFIGRACVEEFVNRGLPAAALLHRSGHPWLDGAREAGKVEILRASVGDGPGLRRALEEFLERRGGRIKAVVHCAAHASDVGPRRLFREVNYGGVRNLTACMEALPVERLVFLSTTDVYGLRDLAGAGEETPYCNNLRNDYPRYKILAERHILETLPPERRVILRPGAVWGPGDTTILPRIAAFHRWSPFVVHFGRWKGANRWPATYVRNVARAARLAALHADAGGKTFNVVDGDLPTMEDFYRRVLAALLPERAHLRSVTVPFAAGWVLGLASSALAALLRRRRPLFDPTLYGLYSVSRDLDIRGDRLRDFLEAHGEALVDPEEALREFRS